MIELKSPEQMLRIKESGVILAETMARLAELIDEGISTAEIDRYARDVIVKKGGRPSFLGYLDFPGSVCTSVNDEVIHGIPGPRRLERGDLIKIDLGVDRNGYFSDAAWTFAVGEASPERRELMRTTRECLEAATLQAVRGRRIHDISRAVFGKASEQGYGVVRQYCGHGVGFSQHEDPQIPNYVGRGPNPRLAAGMVLAIEPMINRGTWEVQVLDDGWTVRTVDGSDSAHYEYTVGIFRDHTEILTPLGDL